MKKKVIIWTIVIIFLILLIAFLYPKNTIINKEPCDEICSCFGWDFVYSGNIKCMGIPYDCVEVCVEEAPPIEVNLP